MMAEGNLIAGGTESNPCYLQKFRLYETLSYFYMIGRDKSRTYWRVLKIDRREPSELNILEDSTTYSEIECCDMLRRIDEGNKPTGGLKFVTVCYGIIGFIKFLEPYYMLLITERRKLGAICGHTIYAISKCKMILIPHNSVHSKVANSNNEKRSFVNSACKCKSYSGTTKERDEFRTNFFLFPYVLSCSVVNLFFLLSFFMLSTKSLGQYQVLEFSFEVS